MNNIYTRAIRLPLKVNGITIVDSFGDYNIYIEEALSDETKRRVYLHEIEHIHDDDFSSIDDISKTENRILRRR